ncbi:MAG: ATP-binding protein, partial [Gemmatimonadales bacterium]
MCKDRRRVARRPRADGGQDRANACEGDLLWWQGLAGRNAARAAGPSGGHGKKATRGCPCGYRGDPVHECRCEDPSVERYLARISGPLLDRIDIHLAVPGVSYGDLAGGVPG